MKIGIVTEYYYSSLGGITEHVHHFALEAKKMGHEPVIITGNAGEDPFIKSGDIRIVRFGMSLPIYSNGSIARVTVGFHLGKKLREFYEKEKFDILHIHSPFVPTLPALTHRYSNTTTFVTCHTQFDSNIFLKLVKDRAQHAFDLVHGKIAVSELCIESMSKYVQGDYRIIPNGVDINKFNDQHEKVAIFDDEKTNIFFLSRLEPRNGLEYLIKAFRTIREKRDDCRLIIGGSGPLLTYYKSLVGTKIKDDVHFIGKVNGVRPNYYSTADIFCFPTTRASFGITILEAMAASKPVVAFSMPAFKTMIESGKNGLLCGEPSESNLIPALETLLDSPEIRRQYGVAARRRAEDFSWEKITKRIVDYYHEVKQEQS